MKQRTISINPTRIDEAAILKRVVHQQDRKALAVLYAKYYQSVLCYIAKRIGHRADAEDLAQTVFVELCSGNGQYEGQSSVQSYLFGIAKNTISQYYRLKKRQPETVDVESVDKITTSYDIQQHRKLEWPILPQQLKKIIEDAVAQLPPKSQEAIRLRFIEELTPQEAAERAGCSLKVFYDRVYEGIKALKKAKIVSGRL